MFFSIQRNSTLWTGPKTRLHCFFKAHEKLDSEESETKKNLRRWPETRGFRKECAGMLTDGPYHPGIWAGGDGVGAGEGPGERMLPNENCQNGI